MLTPEVEELLEQLYVYESEKRIAGEPAAPETVCAAEAAGLLSREVGVSRLTARGLAAGRSVVRRHRLAERLLHDVLQASESTLREDACEFEHVLRHGIDDRICALLGHPRMCPHGRPIPEGDCCRKARQDGVPEVTALSKARVGSEGAVAYLATRESRELQKLMALGILPGVRIRLLRRFPSFVFEVGYSQFTVDRGLADKIHVHWSSPKPGKPATA